MALVIGGLGAWATAKFEVSVPVFVGLAVVSGIHLVRKPSALKSLGVGLYWAAAIGLLVPLLFYTPMLLNPGEGLSGVGTFIGSFLGYFVWGVLFAVCALVTFVVGYFVNKRANK